MVGRGVEGWRGGGVVGVVGWWYERRYTPVIIIIIIIILLLFSTTTSGGLINVSPAGPPPCVRPDPKAMDPGKEAVKEFATNREEPRHKGKPTQAACFLCVCPEDSGAPSLSTGVYMHSGAGRLRLAAGAGVTKKLHFHT
ncbi:unnamed protein product [Pleuronectes platessa]|uniref:Uncharacterized protein n=1 Tax=Pleuronectes platessa TaxID=8262 RepID=A0A9N7U701_PLEPL|nr:unnamed protein product [Pleuronectes platessa]